MVPFDFQPRTRVVFGRGAADRTGHLARDFGCSRVLLVADGGLVEAGHVAAIQHSLEGAALRVVRFSEFGENPDSDAVSAGASFAAPHQVDSIVAVGGGSSLDTAKGINFLLTNGGQIADYR